MAHIFNAGKYIGVRFDKDDWSRGLLPHHRSDDTATRIGDGLSHSLAVDPLRDPGYLLPGYHPAAVTNSATVDALALNGVVNGQTTYIVAGTKLHSMNAATNEVSTTSPWPKTIAAHGGHSGVSGSDVALYWLNGTKYLFYSWNDTTDGDIGRYDLSSTFDDDYVSTVATGGAVLSGGGLTGGGSQPPHPMIIGDDGVLYIANGNKLASLDGRTVASGTFTPAALTLPSGYIITGFSKARNHLFIYAERLPGASAVYPGEATVFPWTYDHAASYEVPIDLPANSVSGGCTFNGVPGCFIAGRQGSLVGKASRLMLFDGARFKEIAAFNGAIPSHGGVEVNSSSITWLSAGNIYRWGTPYQGIGDATLNIIATSGAVSGMCRNFFLGNIIVPAAEAVGLNNISSNYAGNALAYTGLKQLPSNLRNRHKVTSVRVNYRAKVTNGRGFKLGINTDNNAAVADTRGSITYLVDTGADRSNITKLSRVFHNDASGNPLSDTTVSTSLGLLFTWGNELPDAPTDAIGVESVEVYLESVAIID